MIHSYKRNSIRLLEQLENPACRFPFFSDKGMDEQLQKHVHNGIQTSTVVLKNQKDALSFDKIKDYESVMHPFRRIGGYHH